MDAIEAATLLTSAWMNKVSTTNVSDINPKAACAVYRDFFRTILKEANTAVTSSPVSDDVHYPSVLDRK